MQVHAVVRAGARAFTRGCWVVLAAAVLSQAAAAGDGRVPAPASKATLQFARAWQTGNKEMIDYWFGQGADVDCGGCSGNGTTPLMEAAASPAWQLGTLTTNQSMHWLVGHGADVNRKDTAGVTALMRSASHASNPATSGASDVVYLLEHGADARLADAKGDTALHYATRSAPPSNGTQGFPDGSTAEFNKSYRVAIDALLKKGADINAANAAGDTALLVASVSGGCVPETVHYLLAVGADPNRRNLTGDTALSIALDRATGAGSELCNKALAILRDPRAVSRLSEVGDAQAQQGASEPAALRALKDFNAKLKTVNEALGAPR